MQENKIIVTNTDYLNKEYRIIRKNMCHLENSENQSMCRTGQAI